MKRKITKLTTAILLALSFALFPFSSEAQSTLKSFRAGHWSGGVKADEKGKAKYCYLQAQKSNDEFTILLFWNSAGFHVILYNDNWSMAEGKEFQARVRIDNRYNGLVEAKTSSDISIDYVFGYDEKARKAFQNGRRITFEGPAGKRSFRLQGTRKAVNLLQDCADEYLTTTEVLTDKSADIEKPFSFFILGDNDNDRGDTVLHPGDKIEVMFIAAADLSARSWLGFVKSDAAESPEPFHFNQQIINKRSGGILTLEVPQMLGDYRLWMYDRANGILLVEEQVRIEVDVDSAILDVPGGLTVTPGQKFEVEFRASPNYSSYAWVGVVDAGTPIDKPMKSIGRFYGKFYLNNKDAGKLTFTAPARPGRYLLRMQEQAFKKTLTEQVLVVRDPAAAAAAPAITVVASPDVSALPTGGPVVLPVREVFKPGEAIEVRFGGLSGSGQDWLAISALGQKPQQYFDLVMLKGRPKQGTYQFKSLPEGEYEVRLYLDWPDGGYAIVAKALVTVASQPAAPLPAAPMPVAAMPLPVAAIPLPAKPALPVPAAPLPTAPRANNPEVTVVKPVPQAPAAAPPGPPETAAGAKLTGLWSIRDGAFQSISFDQVMELVEGTMVGPQGVFEGELSDGTLTGTWATSDETIGRACRTERLGVRNWGTIEARLAADGTTLSGAWGECDRPRINPFKATRGKISDVSPPKQPAEPGSAKETDFAGKRVVIRQSDNTVAYCDSGSIQFKGKNFSECTNATLKNDSYQYRCDKLTVYRGKNRQEKLVITQINCQAAPDNKDRVVVKTSLGRLQCQLAYLTGTLQVGLCSEIKPVSFVYPADGDTYVCPANGDIRFDKKTGAATSLGKCRTDGAVFKAGLAGLGLAKPRCGEWNFAGYCTQKGIADQISLRPGDDTKVVCESGYNIRRNGVVAGCTLAAPAMIPLPGPGGDKAACTGKIRLSKAGFVTDCTLETPSPVSVTMLGGAGKAICNADKLRFFANGELKSCEEFQTPISVKTPKTSVMCTGVSYDGNAGNPFLRYCGFSGAGEVQDSDGNVLICDQARQMEVVALNSAGAIDVSKYAKQRKGFCRLKS